MLCENNKNNVFEKRGTFMQVVAQHRQTAIAHRLKPVLLCCLALTVFHLSACASKPQVVATRTMPSPNTYVVKPGDTLSGIAGRYGLNYIQVAQLNNISPPYTIYVNQALRLKADGTAVQPVVAPPAPIVPKQPSIPPIQKQSIPLPTPTAKTQTTPVASKVVEVTPPQVTSNGLVWVKPSTAPVIAAYDLANNIRGIRYGGQVGDPVVAAADGQVVYADSGLKEFGNLILIKHSNGYISAYAHNNKLLVQSGARVKAGQKIAEMGSSGTTRVMLEFQIRSDGKAIDPRQVIPMN